jgi:hypothetical protein
MQNNIKNKMKSKMEELTKKMSAKRKNEVGGLGENKDGDV